ncbi:MAG TPA: hypothetical protein PKY59_05700 [Pyrinomonadaceae bacterium]|nr:hypothetical protein [Pyrinomonadaceae bacterium]
MDVAFKILAVILGGIAAYFVWQKNGDGAFLCGVFGAVCFFISIRFQVKERLKEREKLREEEEMRRREEEENFDSQDALNDISANEQLAADEGRRTKNEIL